MSRLKIGDKIEAEIEGVDPKGRGTFKIGEKPGLSYFVIPGEKIQGSITARTKGNLRVSVEQIIKTSPDRVLPPCASAGVCGGCPWMMMSYERQCALKLESVNNAFAAEGLTTRYTLDATRLIPASEQTHHRNRMDYVFAVDGSLGLKTPEHWDTVINVNGCLMLSESAVKIMEIARRLTRESGVPFWNNRTHSGFWRYLVIREGKNSNERLVLITTSGELANLPLREKFIEEIKPFATSLLWGVNAEITDLSIPKTIEPLFGEPYLTETINGFSYHIPCASFFQTNSQMAAVLQNTVVEFAAPAPGEKIMDLYCGSGFLTLALAKVAEKVIGVELDDAAVEIARGNAKLNNIENIDFRSGATEKLLSNALADMSPDTIILDPPRVGLHPTALEAIMGSDTKKIVYVSCNPVALARDLKTLLTKYTVEQMRCVDLFPHTPHIETIVSLTLNNS